MSSSKGKTVLLNVGGTKYEVARSTIERYPDTMLARLISDTWHQQQQQEESDGEKKEIFIDRDGHRFRFVLDYMRDKAVALPMNVSKESLLKDLEYFGFEGVNQDAITCRAANAEALAHMRMRAKNDKEKIVELRMLADLTDIALQCVTAYMQDPSGRSIGVNLTEEYRQRCVRLGPNKYDLDLHTKDVFNKCLAEYGLRFHCTNGKNVWVAPVENAS